jgi:hypothetical protein
LFVDFQIFPHLPRQLLQLVEERVVEQLAQDLVAPKLLLVEEKEPVELAPGPVAPKLLLVVGEVAEEPQQLLVVAPGPQVVPVKLLEDSVELVGEAELNPLEDPDSNPQEHPQQNPVEVVPRLRPQQPEQVECSGALHHGN